MVDVSRQRVRYFSRNIVYGLAYSYIEAKISRHHPGLEDVSAASNCTAFDDEDQLSRSGMSSLSCGCN